MLSAVGIGPAASSGMVASSPTKDIPAAVDGADLGAGSDGGAAQFEELGMEPARRFAERGLGLVGQAERFGGEPGGQRAVFEGAGFIHLISKEIWAGHPCCSVTAAARPATRA